MADSRNEPEWMDSARKVFGEAPPSRHTRNGESRKIPPVEFPDPIPASLLRKRDGDARWLWQGIIARGSITLLSALWKVGKSTLLAHLLHRFASEGTFCGLAIQPCKVLYITEEAEDIWADRRDDLGIADNVQFQVRPFTARPDFLRWDDFLAHLRTVRETFPYDLLILDTISNLWPVRDENDNAQVGGALMPLWSIDKDLAILLNHHLRKTDGQEATASRGAGAITAFVDTILELRRYDPANRKDRRRVLSGYGRFTDTPEELVVELAADGSGYEARGDRLDTVRIDLAATLASLLPNEAPGLTYSEIVGSWPSDTTPRKTALLASLGHEVDHGRIVREGKGVRGSPYTYWVALPVSVSGAFPLGERTENRNETRTDERRDEEVRSPWE